MNLLNIEENVNQGGHRMSLDDLKTLQKSTLDLATTFGSIFGQGGTSTILTDFRLVDNANDFDLELPAYAFHSGKIFRINPQFNTAKAIGGEYKLRIDTNINANNPVTYANGNPFNVHIEEYMTLVHTTTSGAEYIPLSTFFQFSGWNSITPAVNNMTFDNPGEYINFRYKIMGNTMFAYLRYESTVVSLGTASVFLPYEYKAKQDTYLLGIGTATGTSDKAFSMRITPGSQSIDISTLTSLLAAGPMVLSSQIILEIEI